MGDSLDFSFSGVKTALLRRASELGAASPTSRNPEVVANLAAGFQTAVVHALVEKTIAAVQRYNARGVLLGGGVAANSQLRLEMIRRSPVQVVVPQPKLCTDNGAMVAAAAYYRAPTPVSISSRMDQDVLPGLRLGLESAVISRQLEGV
jgi:N6-L-threonylcarbamoyladenine synthase